MPSPSPRARTWSRFRRAKGAPAGFGGSTPGGGPLWSDAYRSRRGPSPTELVEAFKSVLFTFSAYNKKAVCATPLRLYVTTAGGQDRPKSYLGCKGVGRWKGQWLRRRDYLCKMLAGTDEVEEVTGEHPVLQSLQEVNPFMDPVQLLGHTVTSLDIIGTAYWQPTLTTIDGARVPDELWALPAQAIWPVPDGVSLVPKGYQYFSRVYGLDELVRFVNPSLRNPYMDGMSPARAAINYARLEDEFISDIDNFNSNGPRPKVIVTSRDPNGSIGDNERKRLRQEFNAVSARGRMGGVVIADGNLDVHPITYQNLDPGVTVLSEYALERLANALDIPTAFYSKETNLANMQAAREWHSENGVEPRCKQIAATLTRYVHRLDPGDRRGWSRLFFAFDPVIEADKKAAAEQHKTYVDMGVMNRDSVALEVGLDPLPDGLGQAYTVAGAVTSLDAVVNPPEPPAPAPGGPGGGPASKSLGGCDCGKGVALKFNPNHGPDGHFANGHGGHGGAAHAGGVGYTAADHAEMDAAVAAVSARRQADVRWEASPAKSDAEAKRLAKADEAGKFLVEVRGGPKTEVVHEGGATLHKVGGETVAETRPGPDGKGWVSRQSNPHAPGGHDEFGHATRAGAERDSARAASYDAKQQSYREYLRVSDLHRAVETATDDRGALLNGSADVHTMNLRLVTHDGPAAKSLDPSLEGDDRFPFGVKADRGTPDEGAIPRGDRPEDHEDNTFDLPNGKPIGAELRRWYRRIAREVLGTLPAIGAPVPHDFPRLTDYADPMAAAMTPILGLYWDEAGKVTRGRLGLDPDEWRVVDPHLHEMIEAQSHDFCASTLATTTDSVRDAYHKLNQDLITGLVTEGESIPALRKRVQSVFTGLGRDHAELIARTEASRAVHAASEQSAKESGVVSGKVWLLSSNACPLCHSLEAASKANPVPLGGEFANVGSNPTYSSIRMPPGHPRCRCSTTYALTPEYQALVDANPPGGFKPGPLGPEPRPEAKPKPEPAPAAAPPKPKPGEPILPGRPIAERIAAYEEGDRIAAELVVRKSRVSELGEARLAAMKAIDTLVSESIESGLSMRQMPDDWKRRMEGATSAAENLDAEWRAAAVKAGQAVKELLTLPKSEQAAVRGHGVEVYGKTDLKGRATEYAERVAAMTRNLGYPVEFDWKVIPATAEQRDYHMPLTERDGSRSSTVNLTRATQGPVIAHEVTHAIEWQNPGLHRRVLEFLEHRCGDEKPVKLRELFPKSGYEDHELGRKDRFDRAFDLNGAYYVGKVYRSENSEVLTMGVQKLFEDPAGFAERDPEYFKFIIGILRGELR